MEAQAFTFASSLLRVRRYRFHWVGYWLRDLRWPGLIRFSQEKQQILYSEFNLTAFALEI
jgi:hypothetical protein